MKQTILFILLTIFFNSFFSQVQIDFKDIKSGIFTYEGKEDLVKIIRTKRKQTEIYNNGKSKLILNIKWINDSTYVLTHKKSINAPGCLGKGDYIKATIIKREVNRYECTYTSNNCGEGRSVFIKIE